MMTTWSLNVLSKKKLVKNEALPSCPLGKHGILYSRRNINGDKGATI